MAKTIGTLFDVFEKRHRKQWGKVEKVLNLLLEGQVKIMALGDDLKASLTAVEGKEDQALAGVATLNQEVQDLIARLGQPGDVVTQEMVDQANSVGTKMQAINDALASIPGAPGSKPPATSSAQSVQPADGSKK